MQIDPLRRIYIISKRRAISGRDCEIRNLTDFELLYLNYMYTESGEIRDFESWAAIISKILPELFKQNSMSQQETASPPMQSAVAAGMSNEKPDTMLGKTVSVPVTDDLVKLARSLSGIMVGSVQRKATPEEVAEFNESTRQ